MSRVTNTRPWTAVDESVCTRCAPEVDRSLDWAIACSALSRVRGGGGSVEPGDRARFLVWRKNAAALMTEPCANPDAAFLVYRDGAVFALHMRCCDIHLKLEPNDHAVEEAIARHLSRVHGYIGSIDEEISLAALLRKLPIRPEAK